MTSKLPLSTIKDIMSDRSPERHPLKIPHTQPEPPLDQGDVPLIQKIQLVTLDHPTMTRAAFIGGALVAAATTVGLTKHFSANSEPETNVGSSDQLKKSEDRELVSDSEIVFLGRNNDDELYQSDVAQYLDVLNMQAIYDEANNTYFNPRVHDYQPGLEFKDPDNEVRIIPPNLVAENVGVVRLGIKTNNEYAGSDGIRMRLDNPDDTENPTYVWLAFVDKDLSVPSNPVYVDEHGDPTGKKMCIISPIYMNTKPINQNLQTT